jgi:hypothetical protein
VVTGWKRAVWALGGGVKLPIGPGHRRDRRERGRHATKAKEGSEMANEGKMDRTNNVG